MGKAKVENIFPLTYNQKILLFHHLSADVDGGIIQVKCKIDGKIDKRAFEDAWNAAIKQYDVLRTSIQWENLSKQLQVVQQHAELAIDWINIEYENQPAEKLTQIEHRDRQKSISLNKAPVSHVTVLQMSETDYRLLWTCHHILLDGWSSRLVLKTVFRLYDLAIRGKELTVDTSIPTMIDYLNAVEKQSSNNEDEIKDYWNKQIDGKQFQNKVSDFYSVPHSIDSFKSIEVSINGRGLVDSAKNYHITLTSLLQTAWLVTLKWLHKSDLVVCGTVVSGRTFDLPDIEKVAGLMSNVLPLIHEFKPGQSVADAAKQIQKQQAKARKFETVNIDQIKQWFNWEGNPDLFDTLLVIENFLEEDIQSQFLNISDYRSGLTTTYPITIAVVPGEDIKIHCIWNEAIVDKNLVEKIFETYQHILTQTVDKDIDQIFHSLGLPPAAPVTYDSEAYQTQNFESAVNSTELELTKIWEHVLGLKVIGTTDNFFALGGKSIQAVQLFREIEKKFKKTLSPSVLIQHPTIKQLGKLITDDGGIKFSSVVPLKPSGQKPPLFCIHAGGAHILFYKKFAESFGNDYPVYAIQPKGLDGGDMPASIEEMALDYFDEITAVTKGKGFYVLGYCFGNVVSLEIARIAKEHNLATELLIIDSANLPWLQQHKLLDKKRDLILNIAKKVMGMGWQGIGRYFQRTFNQKLRKTVANTQKSSNGKISDFQNHAVTHEERVGKNMIKLNNQYHWNPVDTKIHLIRSSQHINDSRRDFHVNLWEILSKHNLATYKVQGKHASIFEGESSKEMAQTIETIIDRDIK